MFSGVFWNVVNVPLEDIERIEIVRGPGATLWGANAVNGVINIITRSAAASQGMRVTMGTGTEDRAFGSFRFGGRVADQTSYRFDVGASQNDASAGIGTVEAIDEWQATRVGFLMETEVATNQDITVEGVYAASEADDRWLNPSLQPPYQVVEINRARYTAGFLSGSWTRRFDGGSTTAQLLDERSYIDELRFDQGRHNMEVDVQHAQHVGTSQEFVVGASYRYSDDDTTPGMLLVLTPNDRALHQWSVFAQDEVAVRDGLRLTLGAKLEHNDYTGWEFQPNIRALVSVSPTQSIWGAVSRAVRLPSRAESDAQLFIGVMPPSPASPFPQRLVLTHNGDEPRSEELIAFETGYRLQPTSSLSLDVSAYHNRYDSLVLGGIQGTPSFAFEPVPHVTVPLFHGNLGRTNLSGAEVAVDWYPSPSARFSGAYSWFHDGGLTGIDAAEVISLTGDYPKRQAYIRGAFNLPGLVELDVATRYVGPLLGRNIDGYVTADVRIGFRFDEFDLSLIGRNLLQGEHLEYLPELLNTASTQVERAVAIRLTWKR
jgi:iron complex outermembrane receptor protein